MLLALMLHPLPIKAGKDLDKHGNHPFRFQAMHRSADNINKWTPVDHQARRGESWIERWRRELSSVFVS